MKNLHDILKKENYKKVKFKITKTQHLLIKAKINGVGYDCVGNIGHRSVKSQVMKKNQQASNAFDVVKKC